jgi:RNA polymerase sigma-70 factor, ECF subfamily
MGGNRGIRLMVIEGSGDIQVFQRALAGEEDAFVALYRRWQGGIYRFALRVSDSATIAEDVTQEVFMALMDGAASFNPALGSFSSYLFGIARNQVLRRMTKERVFAPMLEDREDEAPGFQAMVDTESDPLGRLTRQERLDSLHRAVASLPLRYREVVVLCELQELSYGEAARVVGCPEGTIRSRLHRARILLLEKFRERAEAVSRTPRIEPVRCLP